MKKCGVLSIAAVDLKPFHEERHNAVGIGCIWYDV